MAGNTKRKNKRGLAFVSIFLLLILAAAGGVSSDRNKDNTTGTTEAVATSEITTEAFAGDDRDVAGRPADTLSGKDDNSDIPGDGSGSDVVAPTTESDRPVFVAVPADDSEAYAIINDNMPGFSDEDKKSTEPFEEYSELDELGRCGVAYADICKELMPAKERGEIGQIKPSGWHTVKYNGIVDGNYLYNRCHLIAYQLAGENANEKNLITGTRYLNVQGMVPFEDQVAQYVKDTGNHVLYRVTPYFEGDNLVANGVQIEAYDCDPTQLVAGIGPSISQAAFEVGEEVVKAFQMAGFPMERILRRNAETQKAHIDLWETNRLQLLEAGLLSGHIEIAGICTYIRYEDYFSARRLSVKSGRILTGICLKKS